MFIQNFRVCLGSVYSDIHDQEIGVPQGCILSVTLFISKINSIADVIPSALKSFFLLMISQSVVPLKIWLQ